MEEKSLHRDWVKNAAIIFLSVLLVLTFFSNTIMNRTLPEAAAKQVTSGSIVAQVRVSGTVQADGSYEVKADRSREIRSVMVRVGDEVETGDVLFVLGEGDSEELETAQDNLRALQLSYQRAAISAQNYDYTLEEKELKKAEDAKNAAAAEIARIEELERQEAEEKDPETKELIKAAEKKVKDAQENLDSLVERRENAIAEAEADMNAKWTEYETAHQTLQNMLAGEYDPESEEYIAAVENDASAEATYNDAKAKYAEIVNNEDPAIAAAQTSLEKATAEYEILVPPTGKYESEKRAAEERFSEASDTYERLKYELDRQKENDSKSQSLAWLELSELGSQIEKAKAKVSELSGGEENEVTANVSGTVQSISITAGSMASKGTVLCVIEVPDLGYSLTATVTGEQARRLHVGDTATVSNYYWGSQIVATLKSMQNDPKDPQNSRILTFTVEGDVSAGSELKLSVGSRSASYDTILPNSAVRTDSNGSFVLVIQEKSSPLGNRYIAVRQPVDVLASDDQNSAVTGGVNAGDFVITTTSRPVESGDQVRMAD